MVVTWQVLVLFCVRGRARIFHLFSFRFFFWLLPMRNWNPGHFNRCFTNCFLCNSNTSFPEAWNPDSEDKIYCFCMCLHFLCQPSPQMLVCFVCQMRLKWLPPVYENVTYKLSCSSNVVLSIPLWLGVKLFGEKELARTSSGTYFVLSPAHSTLPWSIQDIVAKLMKTRPVWKYHSCLSVCK